MAESTSAPNNLAQYLGAQAKEMRATREDAAAQSSAKASQTLEMLPLEVLDDNPFQPRLAMDDRRLKELAATIEGQGLLQPILVYPTGEGRYVTVAGHRRRAAFAWLRGQAKSPEDKKRYGFIPALVCAVPTDSKLAVDAYVENKDRADLTPLEEGRALDVMVEKGLADTNQALATLVHQPLKRVQRLRRLSAAPQSVRDAVDPGVMVPSGEKNEEGGDKLERRQLDLLAALQFIRLHEQYSKTTPKRADARIEAAMRKALGSNWPYRRIEAFVDDALSSGAPDESGEDNDEAASAAPIFSRSSKSLTIHLDRLASASAHQLTELRELLREVVPSR